MSPHRKYTATGSYCVGRLSIGLIGGEHYWPIIDPQGNQVCTVLGISYVNPKEDPGNRRSRAQADALVAILNGNGPTR